MAANEQWSCRNGKRWLTVYSVALVIPQALGKGEISTGFDPGIYPLYIISLHPSLFLVVLCDRHMAVFINSLSTLALFFSQWYVYPCGMSDCCLHQKQHPETNVHSNNQPSDSAVFGPRIIK